MTISLVMMLLDLLILMLWCLGPSYLIFSRGARYLMMMNVYMASCYRARGVKQLYLAAVDVSSEELAVWLHAVFSWTM